jgi:hypothetical protein
MATIKLGFLNPFAKYFEKLRGKDDTTNKERTIDAQGVSQEDTTIMALGNANTYGGAYAASSITVTGVQFEQVFANKRTRVAKYREMANYPVICEALDNVIDDAIIEDNQGNIVSLGIKKEIPENIETRLRKNWNYLLNPILNFNETAWDTFRRFMIDSEVYAEKVLDANGKQLIGMKILPSYTMSPIYEGSRIKGFMQVPEKGTNKPKQIDFDADQVTYINYGLYGENILDCRGYFESAIKTYNQLKSIEDSLVVYRLVRAPERRVWNIDVGRMPKTKAEEYIKNLILRFRKRMIYDPNTGETNSVQAVQSLTEDYWFAKTADGHGTTVDTFKGDTGFLSELDDILWFLKNMYRVLKIPRSRWEDTTVTFSAGKMNEITREEIKFSRFIERLQRRFKYFLLDPFMTINKLDGIPEQYCNPDLFNVFFTKSNLFKEYKEMELLDARLSILSSISQYIWDPTDNPKGIFSRDFVVKRYFRMPDEEYLENKAMLEEAVKFQKKKAKEEAKRNAEAGIQPEGEAPEGNEDEGATEEEAVAESIRNFGHRKMLLEDKRNSKISMVDTWKKHMSMLEGNITSQLKHK